MAVESSSSTNWTTSDLVITKPTGLAVGDLMVACVGCPNVAPSTPSGWTMHRNISGTAGQFRLYYIVATSTEVAASNFTFTNLNPGTDNLAGGIIRISGVHSSAPIGTAPGEAQNVAATSVTFTALSVTPASVNNLLVYCVFQGKSGAATLNTSTYAIATSNPSWTEVFDLTLSGGASYGVAMAYAIRPQVTATGNATANSSATPDGYLGIMAPVRLQVTPLTELLETSTTTEVMTKNPNKVILETESVADTLTAGKTKVWRNVNKNSSTWDNLNKS